MSEQHICSFCHQPLVDGQAIYTRTMDHYDCKFPNGPEKHEPLEAIFARGDAALRKLGVHVPRAKKPEGEGETAIKAKALAKEAIERELGVPIEIESLWNQQGDYRGKSWDLDRWGLNFTFVLDGHRHRGTASTLATMTDCVKAKRMRAQERDLAFDYSVEPTNPEGTPA